MSAAAPLPAPLAHPADQWALAELRALSAQGLTRFLEPLSSAQGPVVQVEGETLINFSSNDYLSLARDPALGEAAIAAIHAQGLGSGASRLLAGDSLTHHALETRLATWMGTEAALVFNGGYAANVGSLAALCGPGDVLFSDALNHASLVDGCRLSRAEVVVYPHGDVAALRALLQAHPGRRQLVCTESIFSMDGDRAPLQELVSLCERAGAALWVDEAHALGVLGPRGTGLCAELGIADQVDVRMGTLGKALGAYGAFVATSRPVADLLINRARSLVFSTALPGAVCAAALVAVERVETDEALLARLWRNIQRFARGLTRLGYDAEARSPIFPVVLGAPAAAVAAARQLRARGILAKAIRPPTVPEGTSRLRFSLCAGHTEGQLDLALDALRELQADVR